jgi:anti-sigma factor RsiW
MDRHCSEEQIVELARGRLDPDTRQAVLAHMRECRDCAALLASEEALAAGLRALAASQQAQQAPPLLEAALCMTFREQASRPEPGGARAVPGVLMGLLTWRRAAALAAASLALVACLLWLRARPAAPQGQGVSAGPPARPLPQVAAPQPSSEAPPAAAKVARGRRPARSAHKRPITAPPAAEAEQAQAQAESEFVMLPGTPPWALQDGARLVRATMPRSALVSFGLPVNAERAGQPIRVDLILSEDGVARAIRFASQLEVQERKRR